MQLSRITSKITRRQKRMTDHFKTPDFAARVHFIVIGRISIERRLMLRFRNQAYRLLLQDANLAGFRVRVSLFRLNRFQ